MSRVSENFCLFLNSLCRPYPSYRVEGERYNDAEYREVTRDFDELYGKYQLDFKDKLVLDAGCGLGGKSVYYAQKEGCRHVYGVDMDTRHIELANEFSAEKGVTNTTYQLESLDNMSFASNTFDLIFLNGVLEHIVRDRLAPALAELKRVLKPGGRILLEFPPWSSPWAAHLYEVIFIPWCHYIFSDETLIGATRRLGEPERDGDLTTTEHFLELNRCTIDEFRQMVTDLNYDIVDIDLIVLRNKQFLKSIPYFNKFFISSVHAVLSKTEPCPEPQRPAATRVPQSEFTSVDTGTRTSKSDANTI